MIKNYSYKFEGQPNQHDLYSEKLEKLLKVKDLKIDQITDIHKNIAASVQKVFEKKLLEICKEIKSMNISKNLVYAGGCALNSLANKKFLTSNIFDNIFIPYAPGDGGGSIGSALIVAKKKDRDIKLMNLQSPFIGPKFSNTKIDNKIKKIKKLSKFKIEYYEDKNILYEKVARYIFENKIIGFFNDQMEFGARALGNRSILANPCNPKNSRYH